MATIEIRDVLDNETGKTIFPRTHVDAVIGLKDSSFFEKVQDELDPTKFSVKLKSEYTGLWAEGWIAAGGVGSGSGGGGGGLIRSVLGISSLGTPIQTEDLTQTFSSKAIESIFERVVTLENEFPQIDLSSYGSGLSLTKTTVASYLKDKNGNYFLDANGNRIALGGQKSEISHLNLLNKNGQIISTVDLEIDLSSYATRSWVSQNFLTEETDPTVPDWAKDATPNLFIGTTKVQMSAANQDLTGILSFKSTEANESKVEWDSENGAWHFHGNMYADGWVASGGIGQGGGDGVRSLYELTEVLSSTSPSINDFFYFNGTKWTNTPLKTINGNSIIGIGNIAISGGGSSVGISNVKTTGTKIADITIDGVTTAIKDGLVWGTYNDAAKTVALTLNGQQYVLCVNGYSAGGGVSSESDPIFTASAAYGITSQNIASWNAKSDFSGSFNDLSNKPTTISGYGISDAKIANGVITLGDSTITPLTSHQSIYALTLSEGAFTAGTYTPNSDAKSFNIPTTLDHITDGSSRKLSDYVTLSGTQTITGAKTFSTNPVTIADDSGISVDEDSYIDIGDARLVYDSGANALHITKRSGTTATIGLFADGFVAAGGVAGQSTTSYVDLESNQEIGGDKTFTGDFSVEGSAYFDLGLSLSGDINIDGIVMSAGTVDGTHGLDVVANAKFTWSESGSLKTVTIKNLLDRIVALENA